MTESEVDLIARAKAQDPQALTALVRNWEKLVFSVALRLLGNHADASDIRQQAMVRLCQGIGRFDEKAQLSTWLYRIVVNLCRDQIRRQERQRTGMKQITQSHASDRLTTDAANEENEHRDVTDAVARAVERLPSAEREAITLRHFANLSFAEMGSVLDVPVSTLKSRVLRALERLRTSLSHDETVAD